MTDGREVVYLVDDDPSVRTALKRLLTAAGVHVVAYASAQAFLDGYDPGAAGCVLLDIAMPGMSGLELEQALTARGSMLSVIFLTGHGDVHMSVGAMKRGAVDFLTKPVDSGELLAAIAAAFRHNRSLRLLRAEQAEIERRFQTLTPREREVLVHVVAGKPNKQVAAELGTVEKTIKVHRARVMEKMRVRSLAELVRLVEHAGVKPASPGTGEAPRR